MSDGRFLAEGEDLVAEALSAAVLPVETFIDQERPPEEGLVRRLERGGRVHPVSPEVMQHLSELGHPARVIAVFDTSRLPAAPTDPQLTVHLHEVTDPGNVGTVLRAAAGLAPDALVTLSRGSADPLSGKAVRASMGAIFHQPVVIATGFPDGGRRIALTTQATTPIWDADLTERATFVIGSERAGLPAELARRCELELAIPQGPQIESLNAAAAATIALYEAARQRASQTESVSPSAQGRLSNQP